MAFFSPSIQTKGIWIIDADAHTVYANDAMAEILGTSAANLAGEHSLQFVFPEDLAAAQRLFSSKQAGSAAPFHFRLRRADGSSVWVDVQGTPMYTPEGLFDGIIGTFAVSNAQNP
ncbi:MAG TPA: PAS domain-containing protein [Terracidiphilus sp.]|jgi:PAS domain S-box-containing protein